jgi:hypothetical protein
MSMTAKKAPSLKSLEKECKDINFQIRNQNVIVTSPYTESVIASTTISKSISRLNSLFHIIPSKSVITIDALNEIKEKYDSSGIILIGIDILGKKRVKKGSGYPLLIGGAVESEQIESFQLGTDSTIAAAGYVFSKSLMEPTDYDLQLSSVGALFSGGMNVPKKGANKDIIELAQDRGLVEERKGFKLFGATMLPIDEAFRFSTHPYLAKISGNQEVCDKILSDAEIPIQKLRAPISSLSTPQAQRLTSVLTMELDPVIIPQLLGSDYILKLERENSPIRYASGLETIGITAWALNELGALIGVLLGDRGRALRTLLESHMDYHKEVIFTIQRLESNLQGDSTTTATTVKLTGAKAEILPDVGRIALDTGIVDKVRPVVLDNDEVYTIVWPSPKLDVRMVLREFLDGVTNLSDSSSHSITLTGSAEVKETVLEKIVQMNKGAGLK